MVESLEKIEGKFNMIILNFRLFHVVDKHCFNPRNDLDRPIFSRDRQKGKFFVNFILYLPNVMTFFKKQTS